MGSVQKVCEAPDAGQEGEAVAVVGGCKRDEGFGGVTAETAGITMASGREGNEVGEVAWDWCFLAGMVEALVYVLRMLAGLVWFDFGAVQSVSGRRTRNERPLVLSVCNLKTPSLCYCFLGKVQ